MRYKIKMDINLHNNLIWNLNIKPFIIVLLICQCMKMIYQFLLTIPVSMR